MEEVFQNNYQGIPKLYYSAVKCKHNPSTNKSVYAYVYGISNKDKKKCGFKCVLVFKSRKYTFFGYGDNHFFNNLTNSSGELAAAIISVQFALENHAQEIYIFYRNNSVEDFASPKKNRRKKEIKEYQTFMIDAMAKIDILFTKMSKNKGEVIW